MSRPVGHARRHIAQTVVLALAVVVGPGALVRAQAPAMPATDPCALLSDQEVLEATGATAVLSTEAVSSLSIAGYGAGCTRQLEPAGGLPANATLTLDYGLQDPDGRQLYEGQLAVTPRVVHVGGMGDDAFQGLSDEWYAVKGDATIGLSLLGIGVFDERLHRGGIARRALAWLLMSRLPGGPGSPDAAGPVCVLETAGLGDLVGRPFDARSAGDLNCLYAGSSAEAAYALDVRLEDPDIGSSDATLDLVSLGSGEATTVAGLPAWASDEALWVDLGVRLLVVQPMWLPDDASRPIGDVLRSVAEAVVERVPPGFANPTPEATPTGDTDLASLFPTQLRGAPVTVQTLAGEDVAAAVGDPEGLATVVAAQGRTMDDLSIGLANLFNANDRSGSIIAIRLRGTDAASVGIPLLLALQGIPAMPIDQTAVSIAGKDVLELAIPGRDPAVPAYLWTSGDVAWFVVADTCVTYTPEQGCQESAVDRPLLDEILAALP